MRFETSQSTPPHLNRRLQLRMLSFVGTIALLIFIVNTLFTDPPKKQNEVADRSTESRDDASFDFNVRGDDVPPLKPDEFLVAPSDFGPPPGLVEPIRHSREWLAEQAAHGEGLADDATARDREAARHRIRFDKRLLAKVRDNTVGIRSDEADAYFQLLDHVQHASSADLERAATTEVQYINLMTEPDRFRGEPVTIQGDLWRLYEFEAAPNELGLSTLYEAWIFTGDSGNHPYRVVSTSIPHTLTPGENIRRPVRVTGYFFKREGYRAGGGMHVAPTLLAPAVTPFRPSNAVPPTDAIVPYMIGVVTAVGLALLVTLLAFAIGDRRTKRIARQRTLNEPRPSFANLDTGRVVTVEEALQQFAEQERQATLRHEIDATGGDAGTVATSVLYLRDPYATVPNKTQSEDEVRLGQLLPAKDLQNWTTRQTTLGTSGTDSQRAGAQLNRERHETARILDDLAPVASRLDGGDSNTSNAKVEKANTGIADFAFGRSLANHSMTEGATNEVRGGAPTTVVGDAASVGSDAGRIHHDATAINLPTLNAGPGTSKLAEWEREIQQFSTHRQTNENGDVEHSVSDEISPRADHENESLNVDGESFDEEATDDDGTVSEANDDETSVPKKTGWVRYNEKNSKRNRRPRRDNG